MDIKVIIRSLIEEKLSEAVELDEALDKDYTGMLGKFKKAVDKAEEAKSKGDKEKMSKHLEDARNRLFGMKSTDSAKLKTTDHYDRYNKMKGMTESLDEASDSKLDKAMAIINARITKQGQSPKYPSFDSAPEDIKAAARNLAKNMK
jgi:hypothetical protein